MNTLHRIAWRLLLLHSDASRDVFGRGSGLRPSLQISPFLRVCPVNPAGNATYDLRTHHVIHAARSV